MKKTLRIVGMALFAVLMGVNFASCSSDDEEVMGSLELNELGLPANIAKNTIVYRTSNNVVLRFEDEDVFGGAKIINNEYSTTNDYGTITFSSEVTAIEEEAFYSGYDDNFENLTAIVLPASVASIGDDAFYGCDNLSYVYLPNSVKKIGDNAFYDCSLTSINIPSSLEYVGKEAFYSYNYWDEDATGISEVYIKDLTAWCNIECEDGNMFDDEYSLYLNGKLLENLVIPVTVKEIRDGAFSYCNGITTVTISDSVTSIGYSAFSDCDNLSEVTIGSSVENIEWSAFDGCKIETVYCKTMTPPSDSNPFDYYWDEEEDDYIYPTIYVPKATLKTYKEKWGDYDYIQGYQF